MKNLKILFGISLALVLTCGTVVAQDIIVPDSGLYVKSLKLTILKQPHKYVDGYAIRYKEEKLLYEHNDTSWYWRGLYNVDPDLVTEIKWPPWKMGWPGIKEVEAILKDDEKYCQILSFKPTNQVRKQE